jgi:hypothetical protein
MHAAARGELRNRKPPGRVGVPAHHHGGEARRAALAPASGSAPRAVGSRGARLRTSGGELGIADGEERGTDDHAFHVPLLWRRSGVQGPQKKLARLHHDDACRLGMLHDLAEPVEHCAAGGSAVAIVLHVGSPGSHRDPMTRARMRERGRARRESTCLRGNACKDRARYREGPRRAPLRDRSCGVSVFAGFAYKSHAGDSTRETCCLQTGS